VITEDMKGLNARARAILRDLINIIINATTMLVNNIIMEGKSYFLVD